MPYLFDRMLNSPGNRLTALQAAGGAAVIAIATAASSLAPGAAAPPVSPSAGVQHFARGRLHRILGRNVLEPDGATIGRLVDLLVDRDGHPRAAVIDFGGFLGVGSRKIAIDWDALHFGAGEAGNAITIDLDRNQIKAAPGYSGSPRHVAVLGLPSVDEGE